MNPSSSSLRQAPAAEAGDGSLRAVSAAALELIAESGLKGLTLAAIGGRARVSRGLPNYLFGSKAALVRNVLDGVLSVRNERYGLDTGQRGLSAVLASLDSVADFFVANPLQQRGFIVLTTEGLVDSDPHIRQRILEYNQSTHALVAARFQEELELHGGGPPIGIEADALASIYIAALKGVGLRWLGDADLQAVRASISALRALLLSLLATNPAAPARRGATRGPAQVKT